MFSLIPCTFLTIFTGKFHDDLDMTRIEISMHLRYSAIALLIFFNIISPIFSPYRLNRLNDFSFIVQRITSAGVMGLFLYLLTMLPFNYEAHRMQQELEKIFPSS